MLKRLDLSGPVFYCTPKIIKTNQNILFYQNQIQNLKLFILTYPHIKLNWNWHVPLGEKKIKLMKLHLLMQKCSIKGVLTGCYFQQRNQKALTWSDFKNLADSPWRQINNIWKIMSVSQASDTPCSLVLLQMNPRL